MASFTRTSRWKMTGDEAERADLDPMEPLGAAQDAEDDLVQRHAWPQKKAGLDGPDCHLEETLFPRDVA